MFLKLITFSSFIYENRIIFVRRIRFYEIKPSKRETISGYEEETIF